MYVDVKSYHGKTDGIRFGCMSFRQEGEPVVLHRRFQLDRLSGVVRLFSADCHDEGLPDPDFDKARVAAALAACQAYEPF